MPTEVAFFASVKSVLGNWSYFQTKMQARSLAFQVKFAHEIGKRPEQDETEEPPSYLDDVLQRVLDESRAKKEIARYIAGPSDYFFSSIVIATFDGDPHWIQIAVDDPRADAILQDPEDHDFGWLRFDGSQDYYVLDGQHRVRAIQALLGGDADVEFDAPAGFDHHEFPIIIVIPNQDETYSELKIRYRRLFSNLNRYAKPMDGATTIILEEDDRFAISTRNLIRYHRFFQWSGDPDGARVRAKKPKAVSTTDTCLTSIEALYAMNINLLSSNSRVNEHGGTKKKYVDATKWFRPSDADLELYNDELSTYWDAILAELPVLYEEPRTKRRELEHDEEHDGVVHNNNLLFRPIGQDMLGDLVRKMLDHNLTEEEKHAIERTGMNPELTQAVKRALCGLSVIEWRLNLPPWRGLLWVHELDEQGQPDWKMVSETRKKAMSIGSMVLAHIANLGMQRNAAVTEEIRTTWEGRIKPFLPEGEQEIIGDMWDIIAQQAIEHDAARA